MVLNTLVDSFLYSQTKFRWRQEANPTAAEAAATAASPSLAADWAVDDIYIGEQCPLMCSGRGDCVDGSCLCDDGYFGKWTLLSVSSKAQASVPGASNKLGE